MTASSAGAGGSANYSSGVNYRLDPSTPASAAAATAAPPSSRTTLDLVGSSGERRRDKRTCSRSDVPSSGLYSPWGGDSPKRLGLGASSGSKAVLSALRTLQEKIKRCVPMGPRSAPRSPVGELRRVMVGARRVAGDALAYLRLPRVRFPAVDHWGRRCRAMFARWSCDEILVARQARERARAG